MRRMAGRRMCIGAGIGLAFVVVGTSVALAAGRRQSSLSVVRTTSPGAHSVQGDPATSVPAGGRPTHPTVTASPAAQTTSPVGPLVQGDTATTVVAQPPSANATGATPTTLYWTPERMQQAERNGEPPTPAPPAAGAAPTNTPPTGPQHNVPGALPGGAKGSTTASTSPPPTP